MKEDNEGFVKFPRRPEIMKIDSGKTMVYLVAFDVKDAMGGRYDLSNIKLEMPGTFVSDDVSRRPMAKESYMIEDIDALLEQQAMDDEYDSLYFPALIGPESMEKTLSIPMTTAVCLGWSETSYEMKSQIGYWNAGFDDLTNEGKKLYYSLRKLHNNKELRILTFNCI